jgi:hypothetical protein
VCSIKTAKEKGIQVLFDFEDGGVSGRKISRAGYDSMLQFIADTNKPESNKTIKYVFIKQIDRFTRGGAEFYIQMKKDLAKLGVELVDATGIIQGKRNSLEDKGFKYDWSEYSPSETNEFLEAQSGKDDIRKLLTKLIGAEIGLTNKGYVLHARDGYILDESFIDGKMRLLLKPDPVRADFYRTMFAMRIQKIHSDETIVNTINAKGFKTPKRKKWAKDHKSFVWEGENPLNEKKLEEAIRNPIYAGILVHKWNNKKPIFAQGEAMVSISDFNEANRGKVFIKLNEDNSIEILKNYDPQKSKPKLVHNPLFPYKESILCECGKPYWASASLSKDKKTYHPSYHCARKHKYIGYNKAKFEKIIEDYISTIGFTDSFVEKLNKALIDTFRKKSKEAVNNTLSVNDTLKDLELRKQKLIDDHIATENRIIKQAIEKKLDELEIQITNAKVVRKDVEYKEETIENFIKYSKHFISNPASLILDHKNDPQMVGVLMGLIFEEKPTINQLITGTPKLSCIFRLKSLISTNENCFVGDSVLFWNQIQKEIVYLNTILNPNSN